MLSEVPEGWKELSLGELTSIVGGTTPKKNVDEFWNSEDVLWATPTDITSLPKANNFLSDTATKASALALESGGLKLLPVNTVLMTSRATIGYVAIAKSEISTNQGFANFLPSEKYVPLFLLYLLQSKREQFIHSASGSTFKEISKGVLKSITALLPPLNEQHRIAEILSSVDASIQATQAVIEQAERVKRGLMEQLLTGGLGSEAIERGEVPEGWITKTLTEIAQVATGKHDANHATGDGKYRFYTCAADYFACATKRFSGGCIILPGNGANVGEVYYYDGDFDAYQRTYVVSEITVNKRFLLHHLKRYWRERNVNKQYGSATNFLKIGNFKTYEVCLPPESKQDRIAEILSTIDEFIAKQKSIVEQQNRTKHGLMNDLLTGKVRTA